VVKKVDIGVASSRHQALIVNKSSKITKNIINKLLEVPWPGQLVDHDIKSKIFKVRFFFELSVRKWLNQCFLKGFRMPFETLVSIFSAVWGILWLPSALRRA
jgi:hypothetical protein